MVVAFLRIECSILSEKHTVPPPRESSANTDVILVDKNKNRNDKYSIYTICYIYVYVDFATLDFRFNYGYTTVELVVSFK